MRYPRRVRFVVRSLACALVAIAIPVALGTAAGRLGVILGAVLGIAAILWLWLWLPRTAHAVFEAGRYANAARRYRILVALAWSPERERAAQLSRAGCRLAANDRV